MADTRLGQPGPFLIHRPLLSLILIGCCLALVAFGGEAGPSDVSGTILPIGAISALGLAGAVLLVAGLMPTVLKLRLAILAIAMAAGLSVAAVMGSPGLTQAVATGTLAITALLWLSRYTGRIVPLFALAGCLAAAALAILFATGLSARGASASGAMLPVVGFSLCLCVMASIHAADTFAARLAHGDNARLAAARTINTFARHGVALGAVAAIAAGLARLTALTAALTGEAEAGAALANWAPVLAIPLMGGGTVLLMLIALSFLPWQDGTAREADRGWYGTGLAIARASSSLRPVFSGAVIAISALLALTMLCVAPGAILAGGAGLAGAMSSLIWIAGALFMALVLMAVLMSFRMALIVIVPMAIAHTIMAASAAYEGAGPWGLFFSLLIAWTMLRQARAWRDAVAARAKGRELLVRAVAASLPASAMGLLAVVLVLLGLSVLADGTAPSPMVTAAFLAHATGTIVLGHCLGMVLRSIARASERQALSAMPLRNF